MSTAPEVKRSPSESQVHLKINGSEKPINQQKIELPSLPSISECQDDPRTINAKQGTLAITSAEQSTAKKEGYEPKASTSTDTTSDSSDAVPVGLSRNLTSVCTTNDSPSEGNPSDFSSVNTTEDSASMDSLVLFSRDHTYIAISDCYSVGFSQNCIHLVRYIGAEANIPLHYIALCFLKIRMNRPFEQFGNEFLMTSSEARDIFIKYVPVIAKFMRRIISTLWLEVFEHNRNNISCILDRLEIKVEQPDSLLNQTLWWSKDQNAYTRKYLLSLSPSGLFHYVSMGCGGHLSDTLLVESCGFLNELQPDMCVMADKKFKHLDLYLNAVEVQLLERSDEEVADTSTAVNDAIRRLHEFKMFDSRNCLEQDLTPILSDAVVIACALVNLNYSFFEFYTE